MVKSVVIRSTKAHMPTCACSTFWSHIQWNTRNIYQYLHRTSHCVEGINSYWVSRYVYSPSLPLFYPQSLTLLCTTHRNIHKDPMSLSSSVKWTNVRKRHCNAIQKLSQTHTSTLENPFATSATIFTPSSIDSVGMTTLKREHILLFRSPTKSSTQHTIINEGREPGGLETDRKTDSAGSAQKGKNCDKVVSWLSCPSIQCI